MGFETCTVSVFLFLWPFLVFATGTETQESNSQCVSTGEAMKSDYETEHAQKGNKTISYPSIRPSVQFSMATSPARGRVGTVALQRKAVTPWTCHQFIAGPRRDTNNHLHSHLQTILSCQLPDAHVLGLREEARPPRQKPCRHKESDGGGVGGSNININIDDILIIWRYFFGLRSCMKNAKIGGFCL